jgi:ADP-ribose pyrophosphatase YjhB (NUDIX family)
MIADQMNFCPRCGTPLAQQNRFGRLRPVCPACDWIFFPDPKVAAAVLVNQNGGVLLVRRANDPYRGCWTPAGRLCGRWRRPARAAERECLEETGLQIQVTQLLDVVAGQEHPRGADNLIVYRGQLLVGQIRPGDDADQASFFPLSQLPRLAFQSTARILSQWVATE